MQKKVGHLKVPVHILSGNTSRTAHIRCFEASEAVSIGPFAYQTKLEVVTFRDNALHNLLYAIGPLFLCKPSNKQNRRAVWSESQLNLPLFLILSVERRKWFRIEGLRLRYDSLWLKTTLNHSLRKVVPHRYGETRLSIYKVKKVSVHDARLQAPPSALQLRFIHVVSRHPQEGWNTGAETVQND
jgi:hypothetical protein